MIGAGVLRRDVHPLGQVRADGDEHRVEAALSPLRREVLDPVVADDPHAHARRSGSISASSTSRGSR